MLQNYSLSVFLQFFLAMLAYAAPIADEISTKATEPWQYGTGGGIVGFIVLVLDILVWSKFCSLPLPLPLLLFPSPPSPPPLPPQKLPKTCVKTLC